MRQQTTYTLMRRTAPLACAASLFLVMLSLSQWAYAESAVSQTEPSTGKSAAKIEPPGPQEVRRSDLCNVDYPRKMPACQEYTRRLKSREVAGGTLLFIGLLVTIPSAIFTFSRAEGYLLANPLSVTGLVLGSVSSIVGAIMVSSAERNLRKLRENKCTDHVCLGGISGLSEVDTHLAASVNAPLALRMARPMGLKVDFVF